MSSREDDRLDSRRSCSPSFIFEFTEDEELDMFGLASAAAKRKRLDRSAGISAPSDSNRAAQSDKTASASTSNYGCNRQVNNDTVSAAVFTFWSKSGNSKSQNPAETALTSISSFGITTADNCTAITTVRECATSSLQRSVRMSPIEFLKDNSPVRRVSEEMRKALTEKIAREKLEELLRKKREASQQQLRSAIVPHESPACESHTNPPDVQKLTLADLSEDNVAEKTADEIKFKSGAHSANEEREHSLRSAALQSMKMRTLKNRGNIAFSGEHSEELAEERSAEDGVECIRSEKFHIENAASSQQTVSTVCKNIDNSGTGEDQQRTPIPFRNIENNVTETSNVERKSNKIAEIQHTSKEGSGRLQNKVREYFYSSITIPE